MSTDVEALCHHCRSYWHLGQSMGGKYSFGYGTGDTEASARAMELIFEHAEHGHVEIVFDAPEGYAYIAIRPIQPVPDPICKTEGCPNVVESSEDYCTDCLDRRADQPAGDE